MKQHSLNRTFGVRKPHTTRLVVKIGDICYPFELASEMAMEEGQNEFTISSQEPCHIFLNIFFSLHIT